VWLALLVNPQLTVEINDPRSLKPSRDVNYFMVDEKSRTDRAMARKDKIKELTGEFISR